MTDAALLKRQKKEIEELRAKLQVGSSCTLDIIIINLLTIFHFERVLTLDIWKRKFLTFGTHYYRFDKYILMFIILEGLHVPNVLNVFLQSELERERITLELEEEKRAQAEREKVLQEQAKKIENLSSMVLQSNRDENHDQQKRVRIACHFL